MHRYMPTTLELFLQLGLPGPPATQCFPKCLFFLRLLSTLADAGMFNAQSLLM